MKKIKIKRGDLGIVPLISNSQIWELGFRRRVSSADFSINFIGVAQLFLFLLPILETRLRRLEQHGEDNAPEASLPVSEVRQIITATKASTAKVPSDPCATSGSFFKPLSNPSRSRRLWFSSDH